MSKLEEDLKRRAGNHSKLGGKYPCTKCGNHTQPSQTRKDYRKCPACGWSSDTNR